MRYSLDKALVQMPVDWHLSKLMEFVKTCLPLVRTEIVIFLNTSEALLPATYRIYSAIEADVHASLNVLVFPPEASEAMDHFEDHVLLLSPDHSRPDMRHSLLIDNFAFSGYFHPEPQLMAFPSQVHDRVLIAGTWDHLHLGHKFLLLASLVSAKKKLFVGFACAELLSRKQFPLAMQSLEIRQAHVRKFLQDYRHVFPIDHGFLTTTDAVGPAASLAFDALAVTPETARGGDLVNRSRVHAGFPAVAVLELPLLETSEAEKMSSTHIRKFVYEKNGGERVVQHLHAVWQQICDYPEICMTWWSRLLDLHSQPWRHYHTFFHVHELVEQLQNRSLDDADFRTLALACFFHDAIYVPGAGDNEDKALALYQAFAEEAREKEDSVVSKCIDYSRDHFKWMTIATPLVRAFLQLDLSILAAPPHRYVEYSDAIKAEYSPMVVDEENFKIKRIAFLNSVLPALQQGSIFNGADANELAQVNVDAEITRLSD